jgi:hypothetical protein
LLKKANDSMAIIVDVGGVKMGGEVEKGA